ncbi:N-glycosylase/DNA lyase isoform X1 [Polypterus senegalus]|uniref:N-glycosylase/DNA lyase isoform X1 n=2 Tax=Polypterus senegalus TaxID=55291 RepID=UPI001963F7A9|nr:N-glycosylase/DNA lyase isoform X1 [Polypterus senegalus]
MWHETQILNVLFLSGMLCLLPSVLTVKLFHISLKKLGRAPLTTGFLLQTETVKAEMMQHETLLLKDERWRSIPCCRSELCLEIVLNCGQSFRWHETSKGHWTGVIASQVWTLTQTEDRLWYRTYRELDGPGRSLYPKDGNVGMNVHLKAKLGKRKKTLELQEKVSEAKHEPIETLVTPCDQDCDTWDDGQSKKDKDILMDYFQLHVGMEELYEQWSQTDSFFKKAATKFPGVRVLRQDPRECLFSLICTSNNHITRISGMVERLCQNFGPLLCTLDMKHYHDFPSLQALAAPDVEAHLQELKFGYRARYIQQAAQEILEKYGPHWLDSLRHVTYEEAKAALRTLPGVGAKVADCVCLMALDKTDAVPVDTHVWQMASQNYLPQLGKESKTLTPKVYREIGDTFRERFGTYAGWAQSVLFCSDLKRFKGLQEKPMEKQKGNGKGNLKHLVKQEPH